MPASPAQERVAELEREVAKLRGETTALLQANVNLVSYIRREADAHVARGAQILADLTAGHKPAKEAADAGN